MRDGYYWWIKITPPPPKKEEKCNHKYKIRKGMCVRPLNSRCSQQNMTWTFYNIIVIWSNPVSTNWFHLGMRICKPMQLIESRLWPRSNIGQGCWSRWWPRSNIGQGSWSRWWPRSNIGQGCWSRLWPRSNIGQGCWSRLWPRSDIGQGCWWTMRNNIFIRCTIEPSNKILTDFIQKWEWRTDGQTNTA